MKKLFVLLAASAVALTPAALVAGPGGHGGGGGQGAAMGQGAGGIDRGSAMGAGAGQGVGMGKMQMDAPITHESQGPTKGAGWDHLNGPDHPTGQPGFECEDARPGHASSAPGSAFNPDGNAGTHYAGEQPQNSRNTSSVSQYNSACAHQR